MKQHFISALAVALATAGLAACASYYGGGYGGYSYYDGYYDNYYGPVSYGYWGPDNYFYYSTVVGRPYIRDDTHHFRRDGASGWRRFHMRGRPPIDRHG